MTGRTNAPLSCAEVRELLPELALGVLVGSERAAAIGHVQSCGACTEELEELTGTADALLAVLPAADPPAGFEVRLLERREAQARERRLRAERGRRARTPARPARRALVGAAAAAAILGGGIGIGTAIAPAGRAAAFRSVELTHGGVAAGHLTVALGRPGWVFMDVSDLTGNRWVRCVVTERDGRQVMVGGFELSNGYGSWTARLAVPGSDLVAARIENDSGATLASARLT